MILHNEPFRVLSIEILTTTYLKSEFFPQYLYSNVSFLETIKEFLRIKYFVILSPDALEEFARKIKVQIADNYQANVGRVKRKKHKCLGVKILHCKGRLKINNISMLSDLAPKIQTINYD